MKVIATMEGAGGGFLVQLNLEELNAWAELYNILSDIEGGVSVFLNELCYAIKTLSPSAAMGKFAIVITKDIKVGVRDDGMSNTRM